MRNLILCAGLLVLGLVLHPIDAGAQGSVHVPHPAPPLAGPGSTIVMPKTVTPTTPVAPAPPVVVIAPPVATGGGAPPVAAPEAVHVHPHECKKTKWALINGQYREVPDCP